MSWSVGPVGEKPLVYRGFFMDQVLGPVLVSLGPVLVRKLIIRQSCWRLDP